MPYLTRYLHVRAAYLSATRGDGGQNLLGNEQYEALGILRTEELLAARRIDGAQQFFGEEYDFGFSKSADETLQKWGHDEALGDFVRIIRRYRPDVVISRFSGTPADGHGHHQAAGILTREAFRAAADPKKYPDQIQEGLKPWQASKLFLNLFGGRGGSAGNSSPDTVSFNEDAFDATFGMTYPEIGAEARSMHRSQGMGTGAGRGPVIAAFRLEDAMPPTKTVQTLFDGIDLTLNRFTTLSSNSEDVARYVQAINKDIQDAKQGLSPYHPSTVAQALGHALAMLREMRTAIEASQATNDDKDQALFLWKLKQADFIQALGLVGGVRVTAFADRAEIIPGETFNVTISGDVHTSGTLKPGDVSLQAPNGWKVERVGAPITAPGAGAGLEAKFRVTAPPDAPLSQPYWLVRPRTKDYFPVPQVPFAGDPENPPLLTATFQYSASDGSSPITVEQHADVVFRYVDRIYGEKDKPLTVVPAVAVWVDPDTAIFPTNSSVPQALLIKVHSNKAGKVQGQVHLGLPSGWRSNPPSKPFELSGRGEETSIRMEVSPPNTAPKTLDHTVSAIADVEGQSYMTGYEIIEYPHIQTRYWFRPAITKMERFDVKVAPNLRVGYIMGTGDEVPQALKLLGVTVEELGSDDLAFGNLSKYDAIVTGIRAYEIRKDLVANNSRLMDYVKNGGVMIVQYSRPAGVSEPLGPYPMTQFAGNNGRITVEDAPVEILEPVDPFFQEPNRITEDDFKGWVQERGVYFMESWAPEYRPLLSSHDPNEPPLKGGMLLASYGKGLYLYTGYVWNRQLPAGVPGAYRIFANMISLGRTVLRSTPSSLGKQPSPQR